MARIQTRLGTKFGRLTVVERVKEKRYLCKCDCGNSKEVGWKNLKASKTKSCGCLAKEVMEGLLALGEKNKAIKAEKRSAKLAEPKPSKHPLYPTWRQMKERCYNEKAQNYYAYGSRGVSVCQAWLDDFWMFVKDMGVRPAKHTLDRIDPTGNYEPSNCRWADKIVQAENQRVPRKVIMATLKGKTETVAAFCKKLNIKAEKVIKEIKNGRTPEDAIRVVHARKQIWLTKGNAAIPKDYEEVTAKALTC